MQPALDDFIVEESRLLMARNDQLRPQVNQRLGALGLEVITPEITQILKGGGGPHCMTFPLLRDR